MRNKRENLTNNLYVNDEFLSQVLHFCLYTHSTQVCSLFHACCCTHTFSLPDTHRRISVVNFNFWRYSACCINTGWCEKINTRERFPDRSNTHVWMFKHSCCWMNQIFSTHTPDVLAKHTDITTHTCVTTYEDKALHKITTQVSVWNITWISLVCVCSITCTPHSCKCVCIV